MSSPTSHVRELFASALQVVAVLGLDGILNGTGDRVIHTQDGALDQLDFASRISTQVSSPATDSTSRGLSLAPGLDGRRLAAGVRGGHTTGDSKGRRGAVGVARVNRAGRIRIVVGRSSVGGIGLGQAVAGRGADGGDTSRMGILKGGGKGALLVREQSARGILIFAVLQNPPSVLCSLCAVRVSTQPEASRTWELGTSGRRWPSS